MTRRIRYFCLFVILVVVAASVLTYVNLSVLLSHFLSRATGSSVRIAETRFGWADGHLMVILRNTDLQGAVSGHIGTCEINVPLRLAPVFKKVAITDFRIVLPEGGIRGDGVPLSINHLSLSRGTVTYRGEEFRVEELTADQLQAGKPIRLQASISSQHGYGHLRLTGTGTYRGAESEGSGRFSLTGFELGKLTDRLKGTASLEGEFTCRQGRCAIAGPVAAKDFALKGHPFKKPLLVPAVRGRISLSHQAGSTELAAEDLSYRGIPARLHVSVANGELTGLRVSSGAFDLSLAREFLVEPPASTGLTELPSMVRGGKGTIREIVYEAGKAIRGDVEIQDATLVYRGHEIERAGARIGFDGDSLRVVGAQGTFRNSFFRGFDGSAGLAEGGTMNMKGLFDLDLEDIPHLYDLGEIRLIQGRTQGVAEVLQEKGKKPTVRGAGKVAGGRLEWRRIEAVGEGSYRFTDEKISFDPLVLSSGRSRIVAAGNAGTRLARGAIRGVLHGDETRRLLDLPPYLDGTVSLDLALEKEDDNLRVGGSILLDDLFLEIPNVFKKEKGVEGRITLSGNFTPRGVTIDEGRLSLDTMVLDVTGTVDARKTMDLKLAMEVEKLQRLGRLFFLDEETTEGDARLSVSVKGLRFPLRRLPFVTGQVRVRNGTIRLPFLPKPLREISLTGDFKGDAFEIVLGSLTCGTTRVNHGLLHLQGLDQPRLSLSLDLEHLRLGDFQDHKEFLLQPIPQGTILSEAEGDLSIRARTFDIVGFSGSEGSLSAHLRERRISIPQVRARLFGGTSHLQGMVDLSGPLPRVQVSARLHDVENSRFLDALGARSQVIEGPATIIGSLEATGTGVSAMMESMDGNAIVYSRNGVIRRWNLLSKVFGLLNLYDLVRGRVDFGQEGLPYRKLGGTFKIEDGVLSTSDFIVDSPSMFISMDGKIDSKTRTVEGNVAVSPLVALDTTIGKIPILRNILKGQNKGFLYAAYTVKGPIDDPDISVDLVNTIGGKTLEILRNILVLPAEVFK